MRTIPAPARGTWFDLVTRTERLLGSGEEVPSAGGFLWLDLELPAPDALARLVRTGVLPAFALADETPAGDVTWGLEPEGVHLALAGARLHEDALILDRLRVVVGDGLVASLHRGRTGHYAALRARYGAVFPRFAQSHGFLLFEIAGQVSSTACRGRCAASGTGSTS